MGISPFAIVPVTARDWTPANLDAIKGALGVLNPFFIELWPDASAFVNSTVPSRTPPTDATRPMQLWDIRPGLVAPGSPIEFALDSTGRPIAQDFTPQTAGGNVGQNPPETFRQPGTGTPSLTTEILGGNSFTTFWAQFGGYFPHGIAKFVYASGENLSALNFAGNGFRQVPICYQNDNLGVFPYTWPRDIIPMITADGKIGLVHRGAVEAMGPYVPPQQPSGGAVNYALKNNSDIYAVASSAVTMVTIGLKTQDQAGAEIADAIRKRA